MPWGRGGAGNIIAQQIEEASKHVPNDLEANRAGAEAGSSSSSSSSSSSRPRPSSQSSSITQHATSDAPTTASAQDYAHMGRGGAGNWFSPKELVSTGSFSSAEAPTSPKAQAPGDKELVGNESRHRGRGGAGNFLWTQEDEERARRENQDKEIELKEMVVKDVERGLARPDRAFLRDWEE